MYRSALEYATKEGMGDVLSALDAAFQGEVPFEKRAKLKVSAFFDIKSLI
jgi:hypothetical protein